MVENAARIASLLAIVQRWKTSEVALDGDILSRQQLSLLLSRLELVRRCWFRRRNLGQDGCRRACKLASDIIKPVRTLIARSSSSTFPLVRRRVDALAELGSLTVTKDDKGRDADLQLTLARGLVENAARIASLLAIVQRWKTSEVALDGDILSRQQLSLLLSRLELVRRCWFRRRNLGHDACAW